MTLWQKNIIQRTRQPRHAAVIPTDPQRLFHFSLSRSSTLAVVPLPSLCAFLYIYVAPYCVSPTTCLHYAQWAVFRLDSLIRHSVGQILRAERSSNLCPNSLRTKSSRAERSSNLCPNSLRTKSSELSAHQISVRTHFGQFLRAERSSNTYPEDTSLRCQ